PCPYFLAFSLALDLAEPQELAEVHPAEGETLLVSLLEPRIPWPPLESSLPLAQKMKKMRFCCPVKRGAYSSTGLLQATLSLGKPPWSLVWVQEQVETNPKIQEQE